MKELSCLINDTARLRMNDDPAWRKWPIIGACLDCVAMTAMLAAAILVTLIVGL